MSQIRRIVTAMPENSETPLDDLHGWNTPTNRFFVRNHFAVPCIDLTTWQLTITGCVANPMQWTYEKLIEAPERSLFATIECAGNGRSFLQPRAAGVQWGAGAVANAEWTGIPLHLLLKQAGLRPEAVELLFQGADYGREDGHPHTMHFARSLPLGKAMHPDTLLATHMNGEPLQPNHGFPLRLLVPGWYGVANVKWLHRIEVLNHPFHGYFQSTKYTVADPSSTRRHIVRGGLIKSEILGPGPGRLLVPGPVRISGLAWSGEKPVALVEVSTDGGRQFSPATLIGPQAPYSWVMWEYHWEAARPGSYKLLSRAVSQDGMVQPREHETHYEGYQVHYSRAVTVVVQASSP
jgi:DMSO/TMAO reductase YedYZ molybdopterin-dependent catalytic subunit